MENGLCLRPRFRRGKKMRLDAVLTPRFEPVHEGDTQEILTWLKKNSPPSDYLACTGEPPELMTPQEYVEKFTQQ